MGNKPHLLAGIGEKIKRAEENIKNLNCEIRSFILANPSPYRIVREFQNDGLDYVFTGYGELEVPPRFAVLTGEVIYLLRSSLDHLVWALVEKQGAAHTTSHQFPVCGTREKFIEACKRRRIEGVSASAEKIIESVQPYVSPDPKNYFLTKLDEWNIVDKHRLLLVVAAAARLGDVLRMNPGEDVTIKGMSPPYLRRVTNEGVELFRISLAAKYKFEANTDFITDIALEWEGECFALTNTLTVALEETVKLINEFAVEFCWSCPVPRPPLRP